MGRAASGSVLSRRFEPGDVGFAERMGGGWTGGGWNEDTLLALLLAGWR